jgi:SAM-dependent methyltransferase
MAEVDMKENEIRKAKTFNRYLEIVKKDVESFLNFHDFVQIQCPACEGMDYLFEFKKDGFSYVSCKKCSTLFVNPRPPFKALKEFYSKSRSTNFWINEFFKPVAEIRRAKIFRPQAEYISKVLEGNNHHVVGDIGAGFGLFLEELRKIKPDNHYVAIEPSLEMADICAKKGLEVKCTSLEDINDNKEDFDLLTAFELVEHLFDPVLFFKKVYSLLKFKGYFFLTTLNSKGFDILLLWEKSKSIMPPHHLNFFNLMSIRLLLERLGFEIIELATPGRLDWDIVEGMIKNENVKLDRIWELLAYEGSEESKKNLQNWISESNLSSHMSVFACKKG